MASAFIPHNDSPSPYPWHHHGVSDMETQPVNPRRMANLPDHALDDGSLIKGIFWGLFWEAAIFGAGVLFWCLV